MFPRPILRGAVLSVRGSMSPKTIPTLAAFAMRQFGSHAKDDNNATRGFKGKGSGNSRRNNSDMLPWTPSMGLYSEPLKPCRRPIPPPRP